MRIIFIVLGSISLVVGLAGIFLPGLPTTPFLLLSAALFARSSPFLYRKLVENPYFGPYIRQYRENGGMLKSQKLSAIGMIWVAVLFSFIFFKGHGTLLWGVAAGGIIGTVVMGWFVPTARKGL